MIHWLKTQPHYFEMLWHGTKPFEIRCNDRGERGYQVDDILILADGIITAQAERVIIARVTCVLNAFPGLTNTHVALGLHILGKMYGDDVDLYKYHQTVITSEQWRGAKEKM